jgi:hypothetical protein
VEGWKGGRVEGWKDGRMEGWKGGEIKLSLDYVLGCSRISFCGYCLEAPSVSRNL